MDVGVALDMSMDKGVGMSRGMPNLNRKFYFTGSSINLNSKHD